MKAARLFNFTYVKLHPLDISDIDIPEDVFPFVNTDVIHNLELEKDRVYCPARAEIENLSANQDHKSRAICRGNPPF